MVTMLALSNLKTGGRRLMARAFSTSSTPSRVSSLSRHTAAIAASNVPRHNNQHYGYSTTSLTSMAAGAVEEDLDTALDELLASTFDEEKKVKVQKPVFEEDDGHHMKDSKPVPPTLVKEVSFVFVVGCERVLCLFISFSKLIRFFCFYSKGRPTGFYRPKVSVHEQSSLDRSWAGSAGD